MKQQARISSTEITIMVTSALVGAGIMSLPAALADTAGPDAWMSVLVAGAVATLGTTAITRVMRRYPGKTLVRILEQLMGKVIARIIGSVYVAYLLMALAVAVRLGSDQIKTALLPRTPLEFILISLLLVAVYVAREGIEPIARTLTTLFPLIFVPLGIIALAAKESRLDNLLPVLAKGPVPVIRGAFLATFAFLGFEALFTWVAAMQNPKQATKAAFVGIALATLIYSGITLVTITVFTPTQAAHLSLPLKAITDTISTPRVLLERFDVFLFAVWIAALFTTILIQLHLASRFLQGVLGFRTHTPLVLPFVPAIYVLSLLPQDTAQTERLELYVGWAGLVLAIGFPTMLWIWVAIRKTGDRAAD